MGKKIKLPFQYTEIFWSSLKGKAIPCIISRIGLTPTLTSYLNAPLSKEEVKTFQNANTTKDVGFLLLSSSSSGAETSLSHDPRRNRISPANIPRFSFANSYNDPLLTGLINICYDILVTFLWSTVDRYHVPLNMFSDLLLIFIMIHP